MFLLLASNPVHPNDNVSNVETPMVVVPKAKKVQAFGRFFTPLMQIITDEKTISVPSDKVKGRKNEKLVGTKKIGSYVFATNASNVWSANSSVIPSRLIVRLKGVRRLWMLDTVNSAGNVIYKSLVGDKLILTNC